MTELPTIFLSYCSANEVEAEQLYKDLKAVGINVIKDSNQMEYRDSIGEFMRSIRDADFALLLVSEHYLKSRSCLYEVSQLFQEREVAKKLLPVLIDGTRIYGARERIGYVRYWQDQKKALAKALRSLDPVNAVGLYAELRTITDIASQVDGILAALVDLKAITLSKLQQQAYLPLLRAAGFMDLSYIFQLLTVLALKTTEEREVALDEYATRFPANAFYYGVKAGVCRDAGKITQALFNYEKAIELRPEHTEALNNLGELYRTKLNDPTKACHYYERAIAVDPKLTVARLNLGYVRNRDFKDTETAEAQYRAILAYEPSSAQAHLNLANLLKRDSLQTNWEEINSHYQQVITLQPKWALGFVAYGNFLKLSGKVAEGNALYEKAKAFDKTGHFTELLNMLLQTTKG